MRIVLDSDACQGHARCRHVAPDLFDADDEGYAVLLMDGDVPDGLLDQARDACDNCPEYAITLVDT